MTETENSQGKFMEEAAPGRQRPEVYIPTAGAPTEAHRQAGQTALRTPTAVQGVRA